MTEKDYNKYVTGTSVVQITGATGQSHRSEVGSNRALE